jgi:hypothetical protein
MLYEIKADSLVTDDIITFTVESNSICQAELIGLKRLPEYADAGSMWITPAGWQPWGSGNCCFKAVIYYDNPAINKNAKPFAIEYFDDFETAKSFASDFMYGFLYISCIDNDGRLLWLDIDIEDCDGECETCKHRRVVPGTEERIDREPAYYCDKEA